jgi:hypothetical protein
MGQGARVSSIDILQTIAVALKKFHCEAGSSMDDLDVELHRALEWIFHDRKEFWTHERRVAEERVAEARIQLKQAQASRRIADYRPGCIDEQKALEKAKRRLQIAEEKVRAVQHWTTVIERAVDACQRSRAQFTAWLDNDVPKGIAKLNRMSDSLENYVSLDVPVDPHAVIATATASSQKSESEAKTDKPADKPAGS